MKKKLAIIGCGSSGLITLKYALEELSDWQVVAYEATSCITGCWGRQPSGFVSTSTKYTTQFSCYPLYDARVHRNLSANAQTGRYPDFFCDGQYGVPSDFLRNRLLMSFDAGLRNTIGQRFVEFRMRCERLLNWLFPANRHLRDSSLDETQKLRNSWSWLLTQSAKDSLFNMYHNKSDDFLEDVAQGRIRIVGGNSNPSFCTYFHFGSKDVLSVDPDLIVPAIGYRSRLQQLTLGKAELKDFYMGVRHIRFDGLFAVGMTRPIIGNIPSISEIQAYYLVGQLSGRFAAPLDIESRHRRNRTEVERRFANLDTSNVYPVEMFPYCDQLAREMGCFPSLANLRSPLRYIRTMLSPATTMHYFHDRPMPSDTAPIHTPHLLTALLLLLKPLDYVVRWTRRTGR